MSYRIEFATPAEEETLREIFLASDMGLPSGIEDHVVIKDDDEVLGGALLFQMDVDLFHLLTIVVDNSERSRGLGGKLIQAMLQHPWAYCRDAVGEPLDKYRVTTVSRGSSRQFYLKNGFVDCTFAELSEPFNRQCEICPEKNECHSAAMVYRSAD